ncbi:uncharacterized protein LOC113350198 isoform X4 [Papaver somniferum]|uniref:uncharacterized protein LOC113350198 isoform X4 n=1 Tax=Papaver somniferum TaxID=3469 RepID=UPI000E6F77FE|nr:uncharacterized protein LOC113350198 isoform X4 [Papaver somniferum]
MNQSEMILQNTLPDDIDLNIASFLQVLELCSLGSCSKFWRELCSTDYLWVSLSKDRCPALGISSESPIPLILNNSNTGSSSLSSNENIQGWRRFYINKHGDMASRASNIIKFVEEGTSPSNFLRMCWLTSPACTTACFGLMYRLKMPLPLLGIVAYKSENSV